MLFSHGFPIFTELFALLLLVRFFEIYANYRTAIMQSLGTKYLQ